MKRTIVLLLIAYSVTSCHDYSHRYVPKELIPDLKNNEIVCFKDSGKPDIDTFKVSFEEYWWTNTEDNSFQTLRYSYKKYKSNSFFFDIVYTTNFGMSGYGISCCDNFNYYNNFIFLKDLSQLIKNYNETYIFNISSYIITDTLPNKIISNFQKGIIRYEYKDGRVYNLLSK